MGFGYSISAFVVIMLGGLGNLFGGIIAAFALGIIETYGLALAGLRIFEFESSNSSFSLPSCDRPDLMGAPPA